MRASAVSSLTVSSGSMAVHSPRMARKASSTAMDLNVASNEALPMLHGCSGLSENTRDYPVIIQVPCCAKPGQVRCFRHYFERTGIASAMWRSGRDRTIVILGKRGVGKSTTLNYLFGFALATDPAAECTTAPFP